MTCYPKSDTDLRIWRLKYYELHIISHGKWMPLLFRYNYKRCVKKGQSCPPASNLTSCDVRYVKSILPGAIMVVEGFKAWNCVQRYNSTQQSRASESLLDFILCNDASVCFRCWRAVCHVHLLRQVYGLVLHEYEHTERQVWKSRRMTTLRALSRCENTKYSD